MIESIGSDVRLAARALWRTRGFTSSAVLTLALGVGATTAVFSIVYGVLLRPLPFPTADRLVQVVQLLPPRGAESARAGLTPGQIAEWRATSRTLAAIGAYYPTSVAWTGSGAPARLSGATVAVPMFAALGVAPWRGRLFDERHEQAGNEQVVILGYRLWAARFGSSDAVLNTPLQLNGRPYRVIGVMPERFGFPSVAFPSMSLDSQGDLNAAPEFWLPMLARSRPAGPATGGLSMVRTLALLVPGVTMEQATAEANALMPARVGERYRIELVSPRDEEARAIRPVLLLFQAAVLFVLFISCANVINLLLARASYRHRDLVVRLALGASRLRLFRYAMTESVLIGLAGGALGVGFAFASVALFLRLPPYVVPRMAEIEVDAVVLTLSTVVSIGAGLLVGAIAAARTLRRNVAEANTSRLSGSANDHRRRRPSRALVVAETAASVILLAGAGLLLTSFVRLTSVPRGFEPEGLQTFRVALPQPRYAPAAAQYAFHDRLGETLQGMPGVDRVAATTGTFGDGGVGFDLVVAGTPVRGPVWFNHVTPSTFATLGVPLRGREFTAGDRTPRATVAIVNETFARRFFPDVDPIGRRVRFQEWPALEIVGVAGDTRLGDLATAVNPAIYLPQELDSPLFAAPTYLVRSSDGRALTPAIRSAVERLEPDAVLFDDMTMDAFLARTVTSPRLYAAIGLGFALVASMLAAFGLYAVVAYSVGMRTRELGIRIALGAAARAVARTVLREALAMVAVGLVAGMAGAFYLSRVLRTLLFGVEPGNPATLGLVAIVFLAVAAAAAYVPARRATRVDPAVALRAE